ncbi:hypothetical protein DSCO28_71270 [Desulfosarcina ovata subsp. sediminis]|uniref:Uncharacterized protein n=1 Tax=Desulfosarcina ovata subsp. sediminis TaxID=885957 RepID=A0A5K8A288_9BACT|nr:hypothetical protein DSCO28_71270 [Desulfosarcina ovata subsp. sediminis]
MFSQSFDAGSANTLLISFDYEWQSREPVIPDVFSVVITYTDSTGIDVTETLLTECSDSVTFNVMSVFSDYLS